MSLLARGLALQGFLLNPIAMAVQGLLASGEIVVPEPEPATAPIRMRAGRAGRGATISLSDYLKALEKRKALPSVDVMLQKQEQEKRDRARRQRNQHRIAALAMAALPD